MSWRISFKGVLGTIEKEAANAVVRANYKQPVVKAVVDAALSIIKAKEGIGPDDLITVDANGGISSSGTEGHSLQITTGGRL